MRSETNTFVAKILIKKFFKKLGSGVIIGIGMTLGIGIMGIVYAVWSDLPNQTANSPLTATIWNDVVNKINDIGRRTDNIYSDGGKIGIGGHATSSPLEVTGNIYASNGVIAGNTLWTNDSIRKLGTGIPLNFRKADGAIEMIIDSAGKVGIGTTVPTQRLDLGGGAIGDGNVGGSIKFGGGGIGGGSSGSCILSAYSDPATCLAGRTRLAPGLCAKCQ